MVWESYGWCRAWIWTLVLYPQSHDNVPLPFAAPHSLKISWGDGVLVVLAKAWRTGPLRCEKTEICFLLSRLLLPQSHNFTPDIGISPCQAIYPVLCRHWLAVLWFHSVCLEMASDATGSTLSPTSQILLLHHAHTETHTHRHTHTHLSDDRWAPRLPRTSVKLDYNMEPLTTSSSDLIISYLILSSCCLE